MVAAERAGPGNPLFAGSGPGEAGAGWSGPGRRGGGAKETPQM